MKKRILTVAATLAVFTLTVVLLMCVGTLKAEAATYSGDCGAEGSNVTWTLDTDTGVLNIRGEGAMCDYPESQIAPWTREVSSIKTVTIGSGVTTIGIYAFAECSNLSNVVFDKNSQLVTIGGAAFSSCEALTSITLPDSLTVIDENAFYNCSSLTSVTFGKNSQLTTIEDYAFQLCVSLADITIPNSVTSIDGSTFFDCPNLIEEENGVYYVDTWVIDCDTSVTSVNFRSGTKGIADFVIWGNDSLTSITIPDSVISIDEAAFYSCSNLASITVAKGNTKYHSSGNCLIETETKTLIRGCKNSIIPTDGSVTILGDYAFYSCRNMTSITIPNGVKIIGKNTFGECSLRSIVIPDSVTFIGSESFSGCDLRSIEVGKGNTKYHSSGNCLIETETKTLIHGCPNSIIPADRSVTSIGSHAFSGCYYLTSMTIPDGVTSIGAHAFASCYSLTSISLPEGLTVIGEYAFYNCSSLTSMTIPASVTAIHSYAFERCTNLLDEENGVYYVDTWVVDCDASVTSLAFRSGILGIADGAFDSCHGLTNMIIPAGVTFIGEEAFRNCSKLISVTFPDSVRSIGKDAFYWCQSLTNVIIPPRVTTISENMFYNCTQLKSVTLHDGVTSIGDHAFYYCYRLTTVDLPSEVATIGEYAFYRCYGLKSITLSGSVSSIGHFAFDHCNNLTDVYYGGTQEQWNAITIGGYNTPLTNATIHCHEHAYKYYPETDVEGEMSEMHRGECACGDRIYLPHSWGDGVVIVPATYWSTGTAMYSCKDCEASKTEYTDKLALPTLNGTCGTNAMWALDTTTGVLTIGGSGKMTNYATYTAMPWYSHLSDIKEIVVLDGITGIGDYAFCNAVNLESIGLPNSLTRIGMSAFNGCAIMTDMTLPTDLTEIGQGAFTGCKSLSHVEIPAGVTQLSAFAFDGCKSLTSVQLPSGLTSIGMHTFRGCAFAKITLPDGLTSIGQGAFSNCKSLTGISIPDSVVEIQSSAFSSCDNLATNTIRGVQYLGNDQKPYLWLMSVDDKTQSSYLIWYTTKGIMSSAFADCENLTEVEIPNLTVYIGSSAFSGCTSLEKITFPSALRYIGNFAFRHCRSLTSVTVPNGVTYIGEAAFLGCSSLESITLPFVGETASATTSGRRTLFGWIFGEYNYTGGVAVDQYAASVHVTSYLPATLKTVTVTGGNILYGAFSGCTTLTSITLPDGLTLIGSHAFDGCTSLSSVRLPKELTSVNAYAFYGCTALSDVYFDGFAEDWAAVEVGLYNDPLLAVTVRFHEHDYDWHPEIMYEIDPETGVMKEASLMHLGTCPCGDSVKYAHEWDKGTVTVEPTHTTEGEMLYTCTKCDWSYTESIFVTPEHVFDIAEYIDENSHTGICACGYNEITPHEFKWTCVDDATHHGVCVCGYEETMGHGFSWTVLEDTNEHIGVCDQECGLLITAPHEFENWVVQSTETCSSTCVCGYHVEKEHAWDEGKEITPPSHTSLGDMLYTCEHCQYTKYGSIPKLEKHEFGEWKVWDNERHMHICYCGVYELEEHLWDDGVETVPPSYTSVGKLTRTCKSCGATKNQDIPPLERPDPTATIKGASVTLGQALGITYNAVVENTTFIPTMKFTVGEGDSAMIVEVWGEYRSDTGRWYFDLTGVTPQRLGDNILAEVYVDGVLIASKDEYSIKDNLVNQLSKDATSETLKTLIYNTLAYGAAAQVVTGHNVDNMINAGYEHMVTAYDLGDAVGVAQGFAISNSLEDVKISGVSVNFSDVNKIMVQFMGDATLYVNGRAVAAEDVTYDETTGKYAYYTDGIYASELGRVYTFTLETADGATVSTLTYSVNAYSARQQGKTTDNAKLAIALFNYGMAAKAYIG